MKALIIDNYDSFTYNLVHLLGRCGVEVEVWKNDDPRLIRIPRKFQIIVISPGPSTPERAGLTIKVIEDNYDKIPIIGVCLGHQAIGVAFGGKIVRAKRILHGRTSLIFHRQEGLFEGIPSPFTACRYHSLALNNLPPELEIIAWDEIGEIMAITHVKYPVFGIQFHPESYLSQRGEKIMMNFLNIAGGDK